MNLIELIQQEIEAAQRKVAVMRRDGAAPHELTRVVGIIAGLNTALSLALKAQQEQEALQI